MLLSGMAYESKHLNGFTESHVVAQNSTFHHADAFHLDTFIPVVKELDTYSLIPTQKAVDRHWNDHLVIEGIEAVCLFSLFFRGTPKARSHSDSLCLFLWIYRCQLTCQEDTQEEAHLGFRIFFSDDLGSLASIRNVCVRAFT